MNKARGYLQLCPRTQGKSLQFKYLSSLFSTPELWLMGSYTLLKPPRLTPRTCSTPWTSPSTATWTRMSPRTPTKSPEGLRPPSTTLQVSQEGKDAAEKKLDNLRVTAQHRGKRRKPRSAKYGKVWYGLTPSRRTMRGIIAFPGFARS